MRFALRLTGTTACKWDTIIPFDLLWEQYKRIIKDNGAIVLTASQPFASKLVMSNPKMFKYEWIWEKPQPSNSLLANKQPLKYHENILVFFNRNKYSPQMWYGKPNHGRNDLGREMGTELFGCSIKRTKTNKNGIKYPKSIIKFPVQRTNKLHPTQKPVALMEYLIKTYTNKGDIVLDNCMGSGTTGVACKNLDREFIGIELDDKYFEIAKNRIESHEKPLELL